MENNIAKIIREHFQYSRNVDIVNINNIYNDIYVYKAVHATESTTHNISFSVIRINNYGEVQEIPEGYKIAIENALNAFDNKGHKYQELEEENKKLEKKIDFLNDRIKKIKNKQKITSLILDYLDLDEIDKDKFNNIIKKINKSSDLPY